MFAISRVNCASSPRMTRSTSAQLRSVSQAARKSGSPNTALLNISAASRGSIGGEIEFAETAVIGIEREIGGVRGIESVTVIAKGFGIDGGLEDDGEVADERE